jgi:HSP20 family protein
MKGETMARITRFEPFSDSMEDFVRRVFKPVAWEGEHMRGIKLDVEEDDKTYTVKADVPGVKKEDIKVEIDGNVITISAESRREKDVTEGGKVVHSERSYGAMYRSFSLGQDVDQGAASAKYEDGVLKLTLPKKAGGAASKLEIQ